ncbi:hypothetical protein FQN54_004599 [Arachnomyces sp. PD_36]|nr:hypothetical protein FQN54_004599 [Arachnomyces sp. PD_36]
MSSNNGNTMERDSGAGDHPSLQPDDQQRRPSVPSYLFDELPAPHRPEGDLAQSGPSHSPLNFPPVPRFQPEDKQRRPSLPRSMFDDPVTSTPHSNDHQCQLPLPFDDLPGPSFQTEEQQRRPTPPRALFEDLPTAYSSITSREPPVQLGKFPTPSPTCMNAENPFAHLGRLRDLPQTPSHLIRPGSLANQPGQTPYSIPFSSLQDGLPPIMVGPGYELPAPSEEQTASSKELAKTITKRFSKFLGINGQPNKKMSLPARMNSRRNKLTKSRPFSNLPGGSPARNSLGNHNARSSLTQDLNWNQPNFQGARGRVGKFYRVGELIDNRHGGASPKRISRRGNAHGAGSRLSTDFRCINNSELFRRLEENPVIATDSERAVAKPSSAAGQAPDFPLPSPPRIGARFDDARANSVQSILSSDLSYGNTRNLLHLPPEPSQARMNRLSAIETVEEEPASHDQLPIPRINTSAHIIEGSSHPSPLGSNPVSPDRNPYNNQVFANSVDMFNPQYHDAADGIEPPADNMQSVYGAHDPTLAAGGVQDATSSSLAAPEVEDLGPGGSQSSSSQHLSQPGSSFWDLRPRARLNRNNPFFNRGNNNTSTTDPSLEHASEFIEYELSQMERGESGVDVDDGEEDDAADWETVGAESQIFPSEPVSYILGQEATGSSLANYSSYGSFMPESSTFASPGSQVNRRGITHSQRVHQESRSSRSALPSDRFPTIEEDVSINQNVLSPPAPALSATTRDEPDPLCLRGSRYQHPTPINEPHRNPFRSTPPEIPQGQNVVEDGTQGYPTSGTINDSEFSNHHNNTHEHEREGSQNRDQGVRESDDLVSSATAPRDITSFSSSAWITEATTPHNDQNFSTSKFPSLPTTSLNTSQSPPVRVVAGSSGQADTVNSKSLALLGSYIQPNHRPFGPGPIRGPSPAASLPPSHLAREASNLVSTVRSTSSTDRLLPIQSVKPSSGSFARTIRTARDRFRAARQKGSNRLEEGGAVGEESEGRVSRDGVGSPTPIAPAPTAKSRLVRNKTPHRDDLVRERLRRLESTVLADFLPSASSRMGAGLAFPSSARTTSGGFRELEEGGEGEPWFSVEEGRYIFSDPPRLLPVPNRQRQRQRQQRAEPRLIVVVQRLVGRKLVWGCFGLPVLGMGLLLCIGMRVPASDRFIRSWSHDVVSEFHEKERALARRLVAAQAFIFMAVIVIAVVFSLRG